MDKMRIQYTFKEETMKIRPLGERVVIKRLDAEEKTASGIVLPSQAQEKPQLAEVIEVPAKSEKELELKVGDKVMFKQYSGTEVKLDGKEYILIDLENVLAVVE